MTTPPIDNLEYAGTAARKIEYVLTHATLSKWAKTELAEALQALRLLSGEPISHPARSGMEGETPESILDAAGVVEPFSRMLMQAQITGLVGLAEGKDPLKRRPFEIIADAVVLHWRERIPVEEYANLRDAIVRLQIQSAANH